MDAVAEQLSMDEAEQFGARMDIPIEQVHRRYIRCHKMITDDVSDLGDRWDWLNRAVKAGQPAAEASAIQLRMAQDSVKAVGGPSPDWLPKTPAGGNATDGDPHVLALKAVQSRDPEALLVMGYITRQLNPRETTREAAFARLAWTVVACQRGADCSNCSLNDCDTNVMMQEAGNNWDAVQQRAREISAKIDAGQWDQLGLGFSAADAGSDSGP
jgi:hypothetical protein